MKNIEPGLEYTLQELLDAGFKMTDCHLSRGYIRRNKGEDIRQRKFQLKVAGGRRSGQVYIELPNYTSTQYHYRQYLTRVRFL